MSGLKSLQISAMTEADLPAIMALEQQNPGAWNEIQLRDELAQPAGWQWLAKGDDGTIYGYLIGRTVIDEAEILRLAVAADKRRQGVAQQLLNHVFADLFGNKVVSCFLELRVSNDIARALYEKNGFTANGLRKDYYHAPREDAVIMNKSLTNS